MRRAGLALLFTTGCYHWVDVAAPTKTYATPQLLDATHISSVAPANMIRAEACKLPNASEADGTAVMLDLRVNGERCSSAPPEDGAVPLGFTLHSLPDAVAVAVDAPSPALVREARDDLAQRLDHMQVGTGTHVERVRALDVPATIAIVVLSVVLTAVTVAGIAVLATGMGAYGFPGNSSAWW